MSKPSEPGDWSSHCDALFESARTDHAPTAADRARVRSALAQRLAQASIAPAAGADAQTALVGKGAGRVALGKLMKLGFGVACVMAGAFAVLRGGDAKQPSASGAEPAHVETSATGTNLSQPAPEAVVAATEAASISNAEPAFAVVSRSQSDSAVRVTAKRGRVRQASAKVSAPVPQPARAEPLTATEPAPLEPEPSERAAAAVSGNALVQESSAQPAATLRANAQPAPVATPSRAPAPVVTAKDANDVRAELAFVGRINAAMLEAKLRTVLALCAEHERRWPHGTFVQEREGLRAIASCGLHTSGADALARTFLAGFPRAPLAPRVREACTPQLTAAAKD